MDFRLTLLFSWVILIKTDGNDWTAYREQGAHVKKSFSVSGRTELAGNHTDHQNGRILASTVHMGLTARVEGNSSDVIHVKTQAYGSLEVQLNQLSVRPREFGSPVALIRGVAAAFKDLGLEQLD